MTKDLGLTKPTALAAERHVRRQGCEHRPPRRRTSEAQKYYRNEGSKRKAAAKAFDLIYDYGSDFPTLTKGGAYFELANLLFYFATGRRGSCDRVCTEYVKQYRQDGFMDAKEARRIKRAAELATRQLPEWLNEECATGEGIFS